MWISFTTESLCNYNAIITFFGLKIEFKKKMDKYSVSTFICVFMCLKNILS